MDKRASEMTVPMFPFPTVSEEVGSEVDGWLAPHQVPLQRLIATLSGQNETTDLCAAVEPFADAVLAAGTEAGKASAKDELDKAKRNLPATCLAGWYDGRTSDRPAWCKSDRVLGDDTPFRPRNPLVTVDFDPVFFSDGARLRPSTRT